MKESRLQHLLRSRENYRKWLAVFVLLAVMVTAGVGAALHKTGVAAVYTKRVLHCPYAEMTGQVAHTHATDCYAPDGVTLVCPLQELAAHTHTPECYTEQRTLICGLEENPGHVHDDTCYTLTRGALLCADESPEHVHTDECYEMIPTLSCGLEEGAGAHVHSDACWQVEQVLSCGLQELAEHVHDAGCFIDVELTDEEIAALESKDETGSKAVDGETSKTADPVLNNTIENQTNTEEELIPAAEETGAEILMPAVNFEETAGDVRVIVEADEGVFPAGTKMEVKEIETDEVLTAVTGAVDGKVMQVKAVDIIFRNALGEEIQPLNPIRVRMEPVKDTEINAAAESAKTSENENFQVVHVDDEGKGEVVETTEELTQEEAVSVLVDNAMVFDAEHFSVYAFVYTVYYEYEVNGQTYASEVPGAQDVYLSELISSLYVVDATQVPDFMSKIQNVSVSNPDVVMLTPENGDWVIRPVKASDVPEALTITMQDGAVFSIRVDAKGSSEVTSENNTATISTVNDLFLPEATEAKAEILTEENSESAIAAVHAVENTADSTAAEAVYQVYDISLENVTPEEIEEYKEGFNVTVALDHNINGKDFRLYHIHEGEIRDITETLLLESTEDENGVQNVRGFSFRTNDFSEFILSYTVDFFFGEYEFHLSGGHAIQLADLFHALNIDTSTEAVSDLTFTNERVLKIAHPAADATVLKLTQELGVDEVFSIWLDDAERDSVLSTVVPANEWVLISVLPFDTEETLTITMNNGEKIIIRVTDDAVSQQNGSDNLSAFLGNVKINNVETNETNDGTVKVGRAYSMEFSFAETPTMQFAVPGGLTYKVPDGIKMIQSSGTFSVEYSGRTYTGNTFTYDEATNTITVNFSDTVGALVLKSQNASFTINMEGEFTGTTSHFDFNQSIKKDYTLDNEHDVTVDKSGSYRSDDNKVHYTVTAHSEGKSDHVIITDTITGTALQFDPNSVQVSGNSSTYTIEESDNGFIVRLDSMNDQETVTVTYTASVNYDNITGKGTVSQTGNTVEIKADDDPGESDTTNLRNQIDYNPLAKSSGAVSGSGNTKTIPWTITVNEQQLKSVAGMTITDQNNSQDVMKYSGTGITIAVMDGSRTVRTITKTWAELGIDDPSKATGWSYQLPSEDDDLNNTFKYVITYETTVDASGKITDFNVSNGIKDDEGHTGGGGTQVTPGEDIVTIDKSCPSYSAGTSDWVISFNVPKNGLASAVLTDKYPEKYDSSHWIDGLLGSITIEGLVEGESYSIDTSDPSKAVITFYQNEEKTETGLKSGETDRTVTVKLTTENTPDWVQAYSGEAHVNTAELEVDKQVIKDTAASYPKSEGISKSGSYEGTVRLDGREYPIFKYTISLYGVSEASFNSDEELVFTDDFDDQLRIYLKNSDSDYNERRWTDKNGGSQGRDRIVPTESDTESDRKLIFTSHKSDFTLDSNGLYLSVYRLYYYLIPKDEAALNSLEQASVNAKLYPEKWTRILSDIPISWTLNLHCGQEK